DQCAEGTRDAPASRHRNVKVVRPVEKTVAEHVGLHRVLARLTPGVNVDLVAQIDEGREVTKDEGLGQLRESADDGRNLHAAVPSAAVSAGSRATTARCQVPKVRRRRSGQVASWRRSR